MNNKNKHRRGTHLMRLIAASTGISLALVACMSPDEWLREYQGMRLERDTHLLEMEANGGDSESQIALGDIYLETAADEQDAVKQYRRAAEGGNAAGYNKLGLCYEEGIGVEKSEVEAVKLFRKAAEKGDGEGALNLSLCYLTGKGVSRDMTKARKWYRVAADRGSDGSKQIQQISELLERMFSSEENEGTELITTLRGAAEKGSKKAQMALGFFYAEGRFVHKNTAEAEKWLRRAVGGGKDRSITQLAGLPLMKIEYYREKGKKI